MLKYRVIPALLLDGEGLVKTTRFKHPKYIGDPINAIRIFNDKEVDELMVLDISASKLKRNPNFELIKKFAGECFMPLSYGGGVTTVEQARKLFAIGVEKIAIQSAAIENLDLISSIADQFGSQSVIMSIDIKKDWLNKYKAFSSKDMKTLKLDWMLMVKRAEDAGVGEILLNSVDRDGTMGGMELDLIKRASSAISVPLIAVGGVGGLADIKSAVASGANAVAVGAYFVFNGPHRAVLITYPKYNELEELFKS